MMDPLKRVKIAFVAFAELSIATLISAIVLSTVLISNSRIDARADEVLVYIEANPNRFDHNEDPGPFPQPQEGENPFIPKDNDGRKPGSEDMLAGLRYFTVGFKDDGTIVTDMGRISAVSKAANAIDMAQEAKTRGETFGYYGNYRFGIFKTTDRTNVIFLDWENQLEMGLIYRNNALIIGSSGCVLSFLVLLIASRFVTKPIEVANEKQKKFISDASHELKTPLAIISANNEIIEMVHGEDEATQAISKQVTRMTGMIRSLTTLSKLGETARSEFVDVCLSDEVLDVASEFEPAFTKMDKKLTTSITEGLYVKGVETELRKMISILLDNARKYASTYCLVSLFKNGKATMLRIKNDSDTELREGERTEVFDRFFRSENARGSNVEGSGIGLSIAKEIALLHKAKISCQVTNGKEFIIEVCF